ncbi:HAD hydrolase-like protein [Bosea sp. 124]|uniref:HAD hydrolase-like protein n=1 Tax=Bosea sp. 124 TaxID=2135642 RepID=UPI000D37715C|nr:HAD hydrolase-like protein [Bosea sp. 124]PTM42774.1 phosphoglycolate phosphatase [Bosea sp. 124]
MNVRPTSHGIDAAFIVRKRLVIFDFDGTLADSINWFGGVVNELARRYDFKETTPEQRDELRRKSPLEILSALGIPKWRLPSIVKHTRALAAQNIDQIKLFGWVGDLLSELKSNGMLIAVVSSNSAANVKSVLGPHASLIDHYETGSSLLAKSAKFKRVLKLLDIHPGEAVSVGDEVRDIDAAGGAGIVSIGVAWGASHSDALVAAKAAIVAITSEDLRTLLLPR